MTANPNAIDLPALSKTHLQRAEPDLLRSLLTSFVQALMSADATQTSPTLPSASVYTDSPESSIPSCAAPHLQLANYDGASELDFTLDILLTGLTTQLSPPRK